MTFLETQTSDRRSKGDLVRPLRSYWWWQHLLSRVECKVLPARQQCLHPEEKEKWKHLMPSWTRHSSTQTLQFIMKLGKVSQS